jgi:hypothetical protein
MARIMVQPMEVRLLRMPTGVSGAQFASTFCRLVASHRGAAGVIGDAVIIRDTVDHLEAADRLLQHIDK